MARDVETELSDIEDNFSKAPEEPAVSPSVVALVAVLSIGGLLFVGWLGLSPSITGEAVNDIPYQACCTLEPWGSSIAGYQKGTGITSTELCRAGEPFNKCCVRAGKDRYHNPVRLMYSAPGACRGPETSYPSYATTNFGSYTSCCTVQTWKSAPTGFIQSSPQTTSEYCLVSETPGECCARKGAENNVGSKVRVLGSRVGSCQPAEKSYPLPTANSYTACCSAASWRQSPTGWTQGTAEKTTAYCDPLETLSQCCSRTVVSTSKYPMKLLGFRSGGCQSVEVSYPVWIR